MIAYGNHDFLLIFIRNKELTTALLSDRFAIRLIYQHPLKILPHLCNGVARGKEFCNTPARLRSRDSWDSFRGYHFRYYISLSANEVSSRLSFSGDLSRLVGKRGLPQQFAFALTIIFLYCLPGAMPGWCASVGKNTAKCPAGTTNFAEALSA